MKKLNIESNNERRLIYAMMFAGILPLLDSSIANVILPNISHDTGISYNYVQWIIVSYMLSCSAGILISPFTSKKYGIKQTWLYSLLIFMIGSLLVGLSFNSTSLISSRSLQGFGAGILMPVTQSALAIQFGKERLRGVMALIAIPAVFAPAVGPLLGGTLADIISWRYAFFINIPIVLISLYLGGKVIPRTESMDIELNVFVYILFFISLVFVFASIYFLTIKHIAMIYSMILFIIGMGLLLKTVLINNKSKFQIINLNQFKMSGYTLSIIMGFFMSLIFFGFLVFFPLLKSMQSDVSIIYIGFLLSLQGVGAWLTRKFIYSKLNEYNLFLIIGVGIIVSALSILLIENGSELFEYSGFFIRGIGLGVATIATLSAPFEYGQKKYAHDTSAITRITQQIGGAFGGLVAGGLINYMESKVINSYDAYNILFWLSILIGAFSILIFYFITNRK
ncbi:TPA: MFS transporter [Salmonella enterica subsp. enterica serovar Hvittingfoss]|nr:MFS transporter [Salmonella enterica subsp. enterica serovar Hvittingfoss]